MHGAGSVRLRRMTMLYTMTASVDGEPERDEPTPPIEAPSPEDACRKYCALHDYEMIEEAPRIEQDPRYMKGCLVMRCRRTSDGAGVRVFAAPMGG